MAKPSHEDVQRGQQARLLYGALKARIEKREHAKVSSLISGFRTMTDREIFSVIGGIAENRALLAELEHEAKIAMSAGGDITA